MKNLILGLFALLCLAAPASAQIRILNYTGEDLKVDVLHASGQARDVAISKEVGLSAPIGPVNPRRTSLVLVVKTAGGEELTRGEAYSQALIVVVKNTAGYGFGQAGFFKGPAEHGNIKILNATRQEINYSYETPNFQLKTGKVEYDFPNLRDWEIADDGHWPAGTPVKIKLGINEPATGAGQDLVAGGVYFASMAADGKLKLTKISND